VEGVGVMELELRLTEDELTELYRLSDHERFVVKVPTGLLKRLVMDHSAAIRRLEDLDVKVKTRESKRITVLPKRRPSA
jgi:hypothetical protein